jgi:hypothetical protein
LELYILFNNFIKKTKMTQNQKMLLGVGVLAVAGYLLWQQSQKPKSFANAAARMSPVFGGGDCGKGTGKCCKAKTCNDGKCQCCRGFEEKGTNAMGCGQGLADYGMAEL